jgi:pyruvate formate lyase activating enzyme
MIAGIKGTSLIDYPGTVAAVIYTGSCNFRCPFCHNKELVSGDPSTQLSEERAIEMLASRCGFIDGVVVTGGEPTVYPGLVDLITEIKRLGFRVKLDTNGYRPETLSLLISTEAPDFIAMDIKTSWGKYEQATGVRVDIKRIQESIEIIKKSGIEHEFRTTCVPMMVDGGDIEEISRIVGGSGLYTLQQFQPENTLDPGYAGVIPYRRETLMEFLETARKNTTPCRLIGLK